ncbi:putative amino acid ABC transporter periplasmic solute-binding protein [Neobacillus bataviensis LMG 21833]|uniref:Putative amino acid ABC transporter periplasmic solute-binding protein n=1 Tax=Neobacillus bataviensis LMG 21833 TaxID=1117379 RepID=K6DDQ2_9BACI|nr:transporter substrate-binding domain-containing protein [Neobacillus bataviensis]EKN66439.1 putative amino acid ABC transporter periplasmic solute-binding protein [Neobacillus bataviensis LMG 21833]
MKKYSLLLFLSLVVFMFVTACSSEPKKAEKASSDKGSDVSNAASDLPKLPDFIKEKGKLVIGVKTDFPPFGSMDASGKNVGYDIDFAKKLAEYAFGDENAVELVAVTSANRIPLLNSKKVDLLIASLGVTEERKQVIDYTEPYFSTSHMIMVDKASKIDSLEDLKDKNVVTLKGTTGSIALEKLVPSAKQLKLEANSEAIKALKDGRAVAMVNDETVLYEVVAKDPSLKLTGDPFEALPMAAAVRKGEDEWLNWLNAAIKKTANDDQFYDWFKTWFPEYKSTPELLPRAK